MPPGFVSCFRGAPVPLANRNPLQTTCGRRRRPQLVPLQRTTPTCVWVERSATVLVEMTPVEAYGYYIDLESMPAWSPWLKKVEVDPVEPDVSRWVLASQGIEIAWKARNTKVVPGEIIAWKSESGLTNRGRVLFVDNGKSGSLVTLAVAFDVPGAVAKAINNDFIGRFVEKTLLADMKRFRSVALAKRRKRIKANKQVVASTEDAS